MLYSFGHIKILTRNRTKSAVATAAYHSASQLTNEWDGVTHDYTYKKNVGDTFIRMPENAPDRYTDESIPVKDRLAMIWNDVEQFESGINAQLARSNYLALQDEFTLEQNLECVDRFIQENCTSQGMGVTYSVHAKPGNLHVDLMYLMREFDKNGQFKKKSQKEYLCRNAEGEEMYFSADHFAEVKEYGWEKVYRCIGADGDKKNLTNSQLKEASGYKKQNKYPVDRKVEVNTWNEKDLAAKWRKSWEVILNDKFKELGIDQQVDCRSYKAQGNGKVATIHVGWGKDAAERKAFNQEIKNFNQEHQELYNTACRAVEMTRGQIKDLQEEKQSPEKIEAHKDLLNYNEGVVNAIAGSGIFGENLSAFLKNRLKDLKKKATDLIEKYWQEFKMAKKPVFEAQKVSLDNLLKNGGERISATGKKVSKAKGKQDNVL